MLSHPISTIRTGSPALVSRTIRSGITKLRFGPGSGSSMTWSFLVNTCRDIGLIRPFQLAFQVDPPYPTPFGTGGLSFPIQPIQPEGQAYDWKYTPYEIQYNLNVQREIAPTRL